MTAGRPAVAAALRAARARLAVRALEDAVEADPTIRSRYDDLHLRKLLHDAEVLLDRIADAVASDDPHVVAAWAEQVAPLFRRRQVPMDDLVHIAEGLRRASLGFVPSGEGHTLDEAVDEAVRVFRWHRRLSGDGRLRNRILMALYKGA